MIHFPALGNAYTDPNVPDSLFSLIGIRRFAPSRARQYEEWELELMCIMVGEPSRFHGNNLHPGEKYYAVGTLATVARMYTCLNV